MALQNSLADRIEKYLLMGWTTAEVAKKCKCTVRWVNNTASDRSLPRNQPIVPHGETARRIDRALIVTNRNIPMVAASFQQAPCNIEAYIKDVSANADTPKTRGIVARRTAERTKKRKSRARAQAKSV